MHTAEQGNYSRVELTGILSEFRQALEEEIKEIEKSGQTSTLLRSGRLIDHVGQDFWYRFTVEYAPSIPADTPCRLIIGRDSFNVTVVSFEESAITISSKQLISNVIGSARLENGVTVLMERLIKCIEDNAQKPNPAGKRMLPIDGQVRPMNILRNNVRLNLNHKTPLNSNQRKAIKAAITNDITYIWGPPGTGKTTVIGHIVDQLYQDNRTVLVLSHTNTAVDGAIKNAVDQYDYSHQKETGSFPILRLGNVTGDLGCEKRIKIESHVEVLGQELVREKEEAEKRLESVQNRKNKINILLSKNKWVNENELSDFSSFFETIDILEKDLDRIHIEEQTLFDSLEKAKLQHPEYESFEIINKDYEKETKRQKALILRVAELEIIVQLFPDEIRKAKDEVKKHDRNEELGKKIEESMSEQTLKNDINIIENDINKASARVHSLRGEMARVQQAINDHERRNAIVRLMNKAAKAQAERQLSEIIKRLPELESELNRKIRLKQIRQTELDNLLLLKEEIKSLSPTHSKNHWQDKISQMQADYEEAIVLLPDTRADYESVSFNLERLLSPLSEAKLVCELVQNIDQEKRRCRTNIQIIEEQLTTIKIKLSEKIERERVLCAAFSYYISSTEDEVVFEELRNHLSIVKADVEMLDIAELENESNQVDKQLQDTFHQLNELNQKIQDLENQAVLSAKIIGTTLTTSFIHEILRKRIFDTVILDEASMASTPALWCAGYLAERNIVIVGDFLQLPPIVMADTAMAKKWLGKDIFFHSGMQDKAKGSPHENFVMLNDQFRMEGEIADIANMYYGEYRGLKSNDSNSRRIEDRERFYAWYSGKRTSTCVHLIDTESLHAWVTGVPRGKGHSRLNVFSAAVDVDLAFKFIESKLRNLDIATVNIERKPSVLIVAPYKPHVEYIEKLIDLEYKNRGFNLNLNHIRAGTIHSFQGSEADIVIFDLVIDEPHWKANLFINNQETNEDLRKMFNVAVTRAKFKLFVVGDFAYCRKKARNNAFAELLDTLIDKGKRPLVDAKTFLPNVFFSRSTEYIGSSSSTAQHTICTEASFEDHFMADLHNFKSKMIIYSPFMTKERLTTWLPAFADAINAGQKIAVITKALSERRISERKGYSDCERELDSIGVKVIHKKGMHEKLIFVDHDAVWNGSLNVLSFTGTTGEIMHRYSDEELAKEYGKIYDIDNLWKIIENSDERKCPICKVELQVGESNKGGVYWKCIECGYTRNANQPFPADGIFRCECGLPYAFSMDRQPRWVCSVDHGYRYQKMRKSDLRLEKMAALIPKEKLADVKKYFGLDGKNENNDGIRMEQLQLLIDLNAFNSKD